MNSRLRERAIQLRITSELSYGAIRKKLKVPKSTLSYWLHDFPLSEGKILELRRRGWRKGEASRERFRATMRKRRELRFEEHYLRQRKALANLPRVAIYIAGLMLYLGEGDKRNDYRIALANTDPWIIKFFIKWLGNFLDIPKTKLRIQLHLYENMRLEQEKKFWQNELQLPRSQFYKPEIRRLRKSSFSYKESNRHGTCSIFVSGVEKKREIMAAIRAFLDQYA